MDKKISQGYYYEFYIEGYNDADWLIEVIKDKTEITDIHKEGGQIIVTCPPEKFITLMNALAWTGQYLDVYYVKYYSDVNKLEVGKLANFRKGNKTKKADEPIILDEDQYAGWDNWETWNIYNIFTSYDELANGFFSITDPDKMKDYVLSNLIKAKQLMNVIDLSDEEVFGDLSIVNWYELASANRESKKVDKTRIANLRERIKKIKFESRKKVKAQIKDILGDYGLPDNEEEFEKYIANNATLVLKVGLANWFIMPTPDGHWVAFSDKGDYLITLSRQWVFDQLEFRIVDFLENNPHYDVNEIIPYSDEFPNLKEILKNLKEHKFYGMKDRIKALQEKIKKIRTHRNLEILKTKINADRLKVLRKALQKPLLANKHLNKQGAILYYYIIEGIVDEQDWENFWDNLIAKYPEYSNVEWHYSWSHSPGIEGLLPIINIYTLSEAQFNFIYSSFSQEYFVKHPDKELTYIYMGSMSSNSKKEIAKQKEILSGYLEKLIKLGYLKETELDKFTSLASIPKDKFDTLTDVLNKFIEKPRVSSKPIISIGKPNLSSEDNEFKNLFFDRKGE